MSASASYTQNVLLVLNFILIALNLMSNNAYQIEVCIKAQNEDINMRIKDAAVIQ